MLFKTLFQHNYAYRNTLILVNRMQFKFNLSYTIWTKNLVHGLSFKKKKKKKDLQSGFSSITNVYKRSSHQMLLKQAARTLRS